LDLAHARPSLQLQYKGNYGGEEDDKKLDRVFKLNGKGIEEVSGQLTAHVDRHARGALRIREGAGQLTAKPTIPMVENLEFIVG